MSQQRDNLWEIAESASAWSHLPGFSEPQQALAITLRQYARGLANLPLVTAEDWDALKRLECRLCRRAEPESDGEICPHGLGVCPKQRGGHTPD